MDLHTFLLAFATFILTGTINSSNAEIFGNQTVRDILIKNRCLCPCGPSTLDSWKSFLIPFSEGTWFEAISYCNEMGMSIVQIRNKHDSKELQDWLNGQEYEQGESFWIGANDLARAGIHRWGLTNKQVKFEEWATGEPNGANIRGEIEHCVQLVTDTMKWNDAVCSKKLKFICERFVQ
ncbi:C-type lectin 37Db-like [Topomyia yanbarensis]|uniref:C-type lectin 37Db-like n=1 Tax=Topomyia yanbarensis TaxID=2498891 RepID=UPI00273A9D47|nr:C-type lectin 37Db-like [Topomyia yanbarensis]